MGIYWLKADLWHAYNGLLIQQISPFCFPPLNLAVTPSKSHSLSLAGRDNMGLHAGPLRDRGLMGQLKRQPGTLQRAQKVWSHITGITSAPKRAMCDTVTLFIWIVQWETGPSQRWDCWLSFWLHFQVDIFLFFFQLNLPGRTCFQCWVSYS